MSRRVVITGIGVVSPIGVGVSDFFNSLQDNKSGIKYIPVLDEYSINCKIGGVPDISNQKYQDIFSKHELNDASLNIKFAVLAAIEAWENAGFIVPKNKENDVDTSTGIVLGSVMGSLGKTSKYLIPIVNNKKSRTLRSNISEQSMISAPSAIIAGILGLGNRVLSNSSACATGTESVITAYEMIKSGIAERMIAGGTEGFDVYSWAAFDTLRLTTRKFNDKPSEGSRSMSEDSSGFVPSSGAGVVILETYESAIERGAEIYAEIIGGSINSGGQRNKGTMSAPSSVGVQSCIKLAVKNAEIDPTQIDLISGHLTSTKYDWIEVENWSKALGLTGERFPYINATKSMIGHMIGAAGTVEIIASLLQMKHRFIHASINCENLHPNILNTIERNKVPNRNIPKQLNYVIKASFGFGDVNACIVLKNIN